MKFDLRKWAPRAFVALVGLYLAAHLIFFFVQRDLQYSVEGETLTPASVGMNGVEVVIIPTGNGKFLHGWYRASTQGKPTIIYYRGNAGSFTREHIRFSQFIEDGYGFLSFDYRGFPGSPGELSEENILEDALSAFDFAQAKGDSILLWGRSLGSGVATYVASEREAKALALETPYTATVDVAKERYPYMLVDLVMKDTFLSREWMKSVSEPVFIGHGTLDQVISVQNGERLFAYASNPIQLWIYDGGNHNSLWADGIWHEVHPFFEMF